MATLSLRRWPLWRTSWPRWPTCSLYRKSWASCPRTGHPRRTDQWAGRLPAAHLLPLLPHSWTNRAMAAAAASRPSLAAMGVAEARQRSQNSTKRCSSSLLSSGCGLSLGRYGASSRWTRQPVVAPCSLGSLKRPAAADRSFGLANISTGRTQEALYRPKIDLLGLGLQRGPWTGLRGGAYHRPPGTDRNCQLPRYYS